MLDDETMKEWINKEIHQNRRLKKFDLDGLKLNIRFPFNARSSVDCFLRDFKDSLKELQESAHKKLKEKQKASDEKRRILD